MNHPLLLVMIAMCISGNHALGQAASARIDSFKLYHVVSPTDSILIGDAEYQYDSFGNRSDYIINYFDKGTGDWYRTFTEFQTYDKFQKLLVDGYQGIYPDKKSGFKKDFLFDENGEKAGLIQYFWPDTATDWNISFKDEYILNAYGQIDSSFRYVYDHPELNLSSLAVFHYDDTGDNHETVIYRPLGDTAWIPNGRHLNTYDNMDRRVSVETSFYDIDSNSWINDYMMGFDYDHHGNLIYSGFLDWDLAIQDWVAQSREIRQYDDENRLIKMTSYNWNKETSSYETIGGIRTTYTAFEDYTEGVTEKWNRTMGLYENYLRTEHYFDSRIIEILNRIFTWDEAMETWQLEQKKHFYYTYQSIQNEDICQGSSFDWEGESLVNEGIYSKAFLANDSRDSIRLLNLIVWPVPESAEISGDTAVDEFQDYVYSVSNMDGHSYGWIVENGSFFSKPDSSSITIRWESDGSGLVSSYLLNTNGCSSDTTSLAINIVDTDIGYELLNAGYKVFPNPASQHLVLAFENPEWDMYSLVIYSVAGRKMEQLIQLTGVEIQLNVSGYPPGLYLFRLKKDGKKEGIRGKFVVR